MRRYVLLALLCFLVINAYAFRAPTGIVPKRGVVCKAIGTRSEGWYDLATGELLAYANCGKGCLASFIEYKGYVGWYDNCTGKLIAIYGNGTVVYSRVKGKIIDIPEDVLSYFLEKEKAKNITTENVSIIVNRPPVVPPAKECETDADCVWCGAACISRKVLERGKVYCIQVLPPPWEKCVCLEGRCVKVRVEAVCRPGEVRKIRCPDGREVAVCKCVNGRWACISVPTKVLCEITKRPEIVPEELPKNLTVKDCIRIKKKMIKLRKKMMDLIRKKKYAEAQKVAKELARYRYMFRYCIASVYVRPAPVPTPYANYTEKILDRIQKLMEEGNVSACVLLTRVEALRDVVEKKYNATGDESLAEFLVRLDGIIEDLKEKCAEENASEKVETAEDVLIKLRIRRRIMLERAVNITKELKELEKEKRELERQLRRIQLREKVLKLELTRIRARLRISAGKVIDEDTGLVINGTIRVRARIRGRNVSIETSAAGIKIRDETGEADIEVPIEVTENGTLVSARSKRPIEVTPALVREKLRRRLKKIAIRRLVLVDTGVRPEYRGEVVRRGRLLLVIPVSVVEKVSVDATTGKILKIERPWWAILVR